MKSRFAAKKAVSGQKKPCVAKAVSGHRLNSFACRSHGKVMVSNFMGSNRKPVGKGHMLFYTAVILALAGSITVTSNGGAVITEILVVTMVVEVVMVLVTSICHL